MPEYRLLRPHSINRVLQPQGYEVEVHEQLGKWWVEQGIAELVGEVRVPEPPLVLTRSRQAAQVVQPATARWSCCGKRLK